MAILIFTTLLIILDQLSKYIVVMNLKGNPPLVIKEGFLNLFYLENRGAAFGILQGRRIIFTIITIVVILILLKVLFQNYKNSSKTLKLCISLILGGTIGNFIDRIRLHYVVDFVSVRIFEYDFAVFNLADVFIVIGTILLIILIIKHDSDESFLNKEK